MRAIEFQTTIKNGIIEIPREYLDNLRHLSHLVRVILLVETPSQSVVNFIDHLLACPLQVKGFRPLTREEIYVR